MIGRATLLVGLLLLFAATACREDASPSGDSQTRYTPAFELVERFHPGARYNISEKTTVDREVRWSDQLARFDVEVDKRVLVEVTQIDLEGRPLRYLKRFEQLRQRETTEQPPDSPRSSVDPSPLEGRTVEYLWRGDRWQARVLGEPVIDPPSSFASLRHPLLPSKPVRQGDRWRALELPLSIPGVSEDGVVLELRLEALIPQADSPRPVARVAMSARVEPDAPEKLKGTIEGFFLFDLARGRFVQLQMTGTLTARSNDDVVTERLQLSTYRRIELLEP